MPKNRGYFDGLFSNLETQAIVCYDGGMDVKLHDRFKKKLLAALEMNAMSQGELAKRLGCSRQMVSLYLLGDRMPGLDVVERFSEALGLPDPAALIDNSEISQTVV